MKDEPFDKELTRLYQQRKSTVVAPDVILSVPSVKAKYSLVKLLTIFTAGGVASFGIMAIVTHFAKSPEVPKLVIDPQHQVHLADVSVKTIEKQTGVPKLVLPPKPELPTIKEIPLLKVVSDEPHVSQIDNIEFDLVQIVKLPHLKEPELSINPVYKVMPKYTNKALTDGQSGIIRLRYKIDGSGSVTNIDVVNSDVSRELQRSAKRALAKWRYNPKDNVEDQYEIIFEFNAVN